MQSTHERSSLGASKRNPHKCLKNLALSEGLIDCGFQAHFHRKSTATSPGFSHQQTQKYWPPL
jgi:hypothetical protein